MLQALRPPLRLAMAAQAAYYLAGGLWALLHYRSFEAVSGKKVDDWLVKTVAALLLAVAAGLLTALRRPGEPPEAARVAGIGAGLALGWSAAWYALRGRISRVYLLDAAAEATFVAVLLAARQYPRPVWNGVPHDPGPHVPAHP